ncbi:MAG: FHA domain-containing protein [Tannerella sp.]|jgi:uncharacterized protein YbaR (Trm112 family)|nr:FHA domain-containing protein [Tannerella sp.]
MIAVKCPHCKIGLKVDESRIPEGIVTFKCPKCKKDIPLTYLDNISEEQEGETILVFGASSTSGDNTVGTLTVLPDADTAHQVFQIKEGIFTVGREAKVSVADFCVKTSDKTMSRNHIRIEVKKKPKGKGFFYCLSDNNSKNNTLYNGKSLETGDIIVLQNDDEITLGHTQIRFNDKTDKP